MVQYERAAKFSLLTFWVWVEHARGSGGMEMGDGGLPFGGGWIRVCKIHQSVLFFRQIRRSSKIFVQIQNRNHIRKQKGKGLKVNWYMWMLLLISPK